MAIQEQKPLQRTVTHELNHGKEIRPKTNQKNEAGADK